MMSRPMRVAHEAVGLLADELQPAGHHGPLARGEVEEREDQDAAEHELEHRLGDAERPGLAEEVEGAAATETAGRLKSPGPGA